MSTEKLRVLLIETSTPDAQLILKKLGQGRHIVECLRVENAVELRQAFAEKHADVILCSYDPPTFGGIEALRLVQQSGLDLPFLFLSNELPEKFFLHAIRSGADDCIIKSDLVRLLPAIEHNLREASIRREHRAAQIALQENEMRLHAFISNMPGLVCQILRKADGEIFFPYVSEGCQALLGIQRRELERNPALFMGIIHEEDRSAYLTTMRTSSQQLSFWNWEGRVRLARTGEIKWINLRCSPRSLVSKNVLWEGVMFNITQSKLAEIEVHRSQEQLRALTLHVQDVREEERMNIAREVHDNLGSMLTAIKLDSAWLGGKLEQEKLPKLVDKIKLIEEVTDRCIEAARNISRSLRPSVLDTFGIIAAIEMEVGDFKSHRNIPCTLTHSDQGAPINPEVSIALFRILQESLNNIVKHAQATQVQVSLLNRADEVVLTISDNGCGIAEIDRKKPRSFGLRGIQERIAHFRGTLEISSSPGQGTTLTIHIPHHPEAEPLPQQDLF
ncbi:MAG: PAS domain-containing protein [Nitrosomonadales bacterium]|nr:PAS domain-containing protein [Nitrosomonadales bacterium]